MLDVLRKDKRGRSVDVDEFNRLIVLVNQKIWNKVVKDFESNMSSTSDMAMFKILNEPITMTSGVGVLPADYSRIIGEPRANEVIDTTTYTRRVDVISSIEYTQRAVDYLTQPTTTYPVCVIGGNYAREITAAATYGGGTSTLITAPHHGLTTGDEVVITGTVSYNGTWEVTVISVNTFSIATAFVANEYGEMYLTKIYVYPTSIATLYVDYLREPETPLLDYYVDDTTLDYTFLPEGESVVVPVGSTYRDGTAGTGSSVQSSTSNFEWDADALPNLMGILFQLIGIQLTDQNVYQAGTIEEAK